MNATGAFFFFANYVRLQAYCRWQPWAELGNIEAAIRIGER